MWALDVVWRASQKRWIIMVEREREREREWEQRREWESGKSLHLARFFDDDNDDDIHVLVKFEETWF